MHRNLFGLKPRNRGQRERCGFGNRLSCRPSWVADFRGRNRSSSEGRGDLPFAFLIVCGIQITRYRSHFFRLLKPTVVRSLMGILLHAQGHNWDKIELRKILVASRAQPRGVLEKYPSKKSKAPKASRGTQHTMELRSAVTWGTATRDKSMLFVWVF